MKSLRTSEVDCALGIEFPSADISKDEKINRIAEHFEEILKTLGLDLEDPSLAKTPRRVAKMYVEEVFSGLDPATFPKITLMDTVGASHPLGEMVMVKKIEVNSFCEHHFVPMYGYAHVAYIPNKHLIGLSKLHRIVDHFVKRPQLQERLTRQIAETLSHVLQTKDVGAYLELEHHCMISRGVKDHSSHAVTYHLLGAFRDNPTVRQEFFSLIRS